LSGTAAIATILLEGVGFHLLALALLCGAFANCLPFAAQPLPLSAPASTLSTPQLLQTLLELLCTSIGGIFQLASLLFTIMSSVLAILQYMLVFAAGTCFLSSLTIREMLAMLGLVLCSVLALSPAQGWQMHEQIRTVTRATHTAMSYAFSHCIEACAEKLPVMGDLIQACAYSMLALACPSRRQRDNTSEDGEAVDEHEGVQGANCPPLESDEAPNNGPEDMHTAMRRNAHKAWEIVLCSASSASTMLNSFGSASARTESLQDAVVAEAIASPRVSTWRNLASRTLSAVRNCANQALPRSEVEQPRASDRGLPLLTDKVAPIVANAEAPDQGVASPCSGVEALPAKLAGASHSSASVPDVVVEEAIGRSFGTPSDDHCTDASVAIQNVNVAQDVNSEDVDEEVDVQGPKM
jgi:hypothetical protein